MILQWSRSACGFEPKCVEKFYDLTIDLLTQFLIELIRLRRMVKKFRQNVIMIIPLKTKENEKLFCLM
jgi:hypothetical protein